MPSLPQRFDIDRLGVRNHLGFSRGAHGCLGAPLGRMEAQTVIERLPARTSAIEISEIHHRSPQCRSFRYEESYTFRSLADHHVTLLP